MKNRLAILLTAAMLLFGMSGCAASSSSTTSQAESSSETVISSQETSTESSSEAASSIIASSTQTENTQTSVSASSTAALSTKVVSKIASSVAAASSSPTTVTGTIKLSGSTSMIDLLKAEAEAFSIKYPKITVQFVNITGSGSGKADASQKLVDFGMASAALNTSETALLKSTQVATDAVAIIVNSSNDATQITRAQLLKIYDKTIDVKTRTMSWASLGAGSKAETIVTIGRDSASGTRECFETTVLGKKKGDSANINADLDSTSKVIDAVSTNASAIGYASLGDCLAAIANGKNIKMLNLSFDGASYMTPSLENATNGSYKATRPFLMMWHKDATLSPAAQLFHDFIMSAEGQTIVTNKKFVSVK